MKKVIYLKAATKPSLVTDIKKICPDYKGETDFQQEDVRVHVIGDIMLQEPVYGQNRQVITQAVTVGAYHANIEVPEQFKTPALTNQIQTPTNPVHIFI